MGIQIRVPAFQNAPGSKGTQRDRVTNRVLIERVYNCWQGSRIEDRLLVRVIDRVKWVVGSWPGSMTIG